MKHQSANEFALNGRTVSDSRISISIAYFEDEGDANRFGEHVRKRGDTYNGGMFHGMPCGRERSRDYTDKDGVRWYAVTH